MLHKGIWFNHLCYELMENIEITRRLQCQNVKVGQEFKLFCSVRSTLPYQVNWYFEKTLLKQNDKVDIKSDRVAGIQSLSVRRSCEDDEGIYKCIIFTKEESLSTTCYVQVNSKPGASPATLRNTSNDVEGNNGCLRKSRNSSRNSYKCNLEDVAEISEEEYQDSKHSSTECISDVKQRDPFEFAMLLPRKLYVKPGKDVTLSCVIKAVPGNTTCTWYKNNQKISGNTRIITYNDRLTYNLKISDIQEIDEGDYVIQIQNSNNQHTLHGFTTLKLIKEHKPANNETLSWINGNLRNSVKVNRDQDDSGDNNCILKVIYILEQCYIF
ncbi:hypothetical protein GJ496_004359 [Pomphorhynchus laevis]|nr:hypothetical protein GJ496_004359 [Pomphorhynchus laevis]